MLQDVSPKTVFVMQEPGGVRSIAMGLATFPVGPGAPVGVRDDEVQLVFLAATDFHAEHRLFGRTVRSGPDHVVFRPTVPGSDEAIIFDKLTVEWLRELTDNEVIGRLALLRDFDGPDEDEALQAYYRARFLPDSYLDKIRTASSSLP